MSKNTAKSIVSVFSFEKTALDYYQNVSRTVHLSKSKITVEWSKILFIDSLAPKEFLTARYLVSFSMERGEGHKNDYMRLLMLGGRYHTTKGFLLFWANSLVLIYLSIQIFLFCLQLLDFCLKFSDHAVTTCKTVLKLGFFRSKLNQTKI